MKSRVYFLSILLSGCSLAQSISSNRSVRVKVAFSDGICDASTHVRLVGRSGPAIEAVPNDRCEVTFAAIPEGTYHANVYGRTFDTDRVISIETGSTEFEIDVVARDDSIRMHSMAFSPSISADALRIPEKAQRQLEKANKEIGKQEFSKAVQTLQKAIDLYPNYAGAYSNLGVAYARLGDRQREREALDKAVSLDSHLCYAYANLGRLNIISGDLPQAEVEFHKAVNCDPLDGITTMLLAYTQLMQKKFDQAISTTHDAHALRSPHAYAHQIAARAYEQKRDKVDAIRELKLFIDEESTGARSESARKELALLQSLPN